MGDKAVGEDLVCQDGKNAHKPNDLSCQLKIENTFEDTDSRTYESKEKRLFDEQLEGIENGALDKRDVE